MWYIYGCACVCLMQGCIYVWYRSVYTLCVLCGYVCELCVVWYMLLKFLLPRETQIMSPPRSKAQTN